MKNQKASRHYHLLLLGLRENGKCSLVFFGISFFLEGVESNPGPSRFSFCSDYSDSVGSNNSAGLRHFAIKKSIQASHHQGHFKYGESAGMQCTSNAYFSIAYSVIKRPSIWKSWDLD